MSAAEAMIRDADAVVCRPWLRHILPPADWRALLQAAAAESWVLLAHWADTVQAHALLLDPSRLTVVPVSTPIDAGVYPAVSMSFPNASLYQRMIHDLWGHRAQGDADQPTDDRPWLDHGNWPQVHPMAIRPEQAGRGEPPAFAETENVHDMTVPIGPVSGRLQEAAHLRLTLNGSIVTRAEALLGFTHKGTLQLMRGKSPRAAARFAARLSADSTVAHAVAFAQATEAAMDVQVPPRAVGLRVAMLEIERIAVHLDTLAEVARLADAGRVWTHCLTLRESLLRACEAAFGHRLMMDAVVPGGVAADIAANGPEAILRALGEIASRLPAIQRDHAGSALSSRLVGIGRTSGGIGVAGRASGVLFDVRTAFAPAYQAYAPRLIASAQGDAAARQSLRLLEIEESLRLIGAALDTLPDGPMTAVLPQVSGEGIGCAESGRGDIWHWLRIDHGQIAAAFPRDPGWGQWPAAERALVGARADDVDLIRTSLGLSASGMDL